MIEGDIELIASKIGMSINQLYELNLSVQQFNAVSHLITIMSGIITFCVVTYFLYNNIIDESNKGMRLMLSAMVAVLISMVIVFIVSAIINCVIAPIVIPEYCATMDTIDQITSIIGN